MLNDLPNLPLPAGGARTRGSPALTRRMWPSWRRNWNRRKRTRPWRERLCKARRLSKLEAEQGCAESRASRTAIWKTRGWQAGSRRSVEERSARRRRRMDLQRPCCPKRKPRWRPQRPPRATRRPKWDTGAARRRGTAPATRAQTARRRRWFARRAVKRAEAALQSPPRARTASLSRDHGESRSIFHPPSSLPRVAQAVVQPAAAALPEFDRLRRRRGSRPSAAAAESPSRHTSRAPRQTAVRVARDPPPLRSAPRPTRRSGCSPDASESRPPIPRATPSSTVPVTFTCRSSAPHQKVSAARGLPARCRPLAPFVVREKGEPALVANFQQAPCATTAARRRPRWRGSSHSARAIAAPSPPRATR